MPRLFIAIPIPGHLMQALGGLASPSDRGLRWVPPRNLHLTLRFLGDVREEDVAQVDRAIARTVPDHAAAFSLTAQGLGAFPNLHSPRVIWCGLQGDLPALLTLRQRLEHELQRTGFSADERPFRPHITLARLRAMGTWPARLDSWRDRIFGHWTVDRLQLVESHLTPNGPHYSVRSEWRLEG